MDQEEIHTQNSDSLPAPESENNQSFSAPSVSGDSGDVEIAKETENDAHRKVSETLFSERSGAPKMRRRKKFQSQLKSNNKKQSSIILSMWIVSRPNFTVSFLFRPHFDLWFKHRDSYTQFLIMTSNPKIAKNHKSRSISFIFHLIAAKTCRRVLCDNPRRLKPIYIFDFLATMKKNL